jgi:hypothetical protein
MLRWLCLCNLTVHACDAAVCCAQDCRRNKLHSEPKEGEEAAPAKWQCRAEPLHPTCGTKLEVSCLALLRLLELT